MNARDTSGAGVHGRAPSTAELVDRLGRFDGPPEHFLLYLLAVQCHIASASGGAILRRREDGRPEVVAVYPPLAEGAAAPMWLAQAAAEAAAVQSGSATAVKPVRSGQDLYGAPAKQHLVMVPLRGGQGVRGVAAFAVETGDAAALDASREHLELTVSLLSLYEMRLTLQRRTGDLQRLRAAMETLAAVHEQGRFVAAAMTFCNELASRWACQRVSLGFLKGRYVHLAAMSHTEKFSRKMKLVQDIESAMEECLDQNLEIIHPTDAQAAYVGRAAAELSARHGPAAVVSLPLRCRGEAEAVVTLERQADRPFGLEELEALRLTCDLSTAHLAGLHDSDRWFGAKLAAACRKGAAVAVGPKHTWAKLVAIAVVAAAAFLTFAKGDYQAEATFVIEATRKQVVPAPFEGFLKSAAVRPGDRVAAGQELAELDTSELRLRLAAAKAEQVGYVTQATAAMRDATTTRSPAKLAESQIAQASADALAEQIKVLEYRIDKARIVAPLAGVVTAGDLQRQIGAPVKTGDLLFEIAQLESLRAELSVPEDQIADVRVGQRGALATVSRPDVRLEFEVERINPVAEVVKQRNVFKVQVRLLEVDPAGKHSWLRPGLEGAAKIDVDRRRYAWLWSRRLVNWVRMTFWL